MTDSEWNKQYNDWSGCGSGREGGQLCREYRICLISSIREIIQYFFKELFSDLTEKEKKIVSDYIPTQMETQNSIMKKRSGEVRLPSDHKMKNKRY